MFCVYCIYIYSHQHYIQLRPEAAYLYDAVWLYAKALHQAITEGKDYRNGTTIINMIKEKTYKSELYYWLSEPCCF